MSTRRIAVIVTAVATGGCAAASASPRSTPFVAVERCDGPEYHALDFWLGDWIVRTPTGAIDGTSSITATVGHCALEERWTGADGHTGQSLFHDDRALARWEQVWVTDVGGWKHKTQIAAPAFGAVRFQGAVPRPDGTVVLDRTTLTPLPSGRVQQRIERSSDQGVSWDRWEGEYMHPTTASCTAAQRQFDFWLGDWDLTIHQRDPAAKGGGWRTAKGKNHVTAILDGCGIEERFTAEGPDAPWAGVSISRYVDAEAQWRQTWIDDQGSYLVFTGGLRGAEMILDGEPKARDGVVRRMRMVFSGIEADRFAWRWEGTTDGGATWREELRIEYVRARR